MTGNNRRDAIAAIRDELGCSRSKAVHVYNERVAAGASGRALDVDEVSAWMGAFSPRLPATTLALITGRPDGGPWSGEELHFLAVMSPDRTTCDTCGETLWRESWDAARRFHVGHLGEVVELPAMHCGLVWSVPSVVVDLDDGVTEADLVAAVAGVEDEADVTGRKAAEARAGLIKDLRRALADRPGPGASETDVEGWLSRHEIADSDSGLDRGLYLENGRVCGFSYLDVPTEWLPEESRFDEPPWVAVDERDV